MPSAVLLLAADTSLGRLDYALLSQQTLMEMVIDKLHEQEKSSFMDSSGSFLDINEWKDVECGGEGEIVNIRWGPIFFPRFPLGGALALQWLPSTVKTFDVSTGGLDGSLNLCGLPEALTTLDLGLSHFTGSLDFSHLPKPLEKMVLKGNNLKANL